MKACISNGFRLDMKGRYKSLNRQNIVSFELSSNGLLSFDSITAITHQLVNGGLVILPTETGYLLAADALNLTAVRKVFDVKKRPLTNPIHVVVSDLEMAERLVNLNPLARKLCYRFFPGPLTIICPKRPIISDELVANTGNLGIRVPDSPVVLQIVRAFGKPITATSLNVSGQPAGSSIENTIDELYWDNEIVYFVKNDSLVKYDMSSTVITFGTDPWRILREGPIDRIAITETMSRLSYTEIEDWT